MQKQPLMPTPNTMETNMTDILILAFLETIELWAFLSILAIALAFEGLINWYRSKTVDNPSVW